MSMKPLTVLSCILALGCSTALAVDLNTDALQKMQKEGDRIIEEEKATRSFALGNGDCLHAGGSNGAGVTVKKCNANAKNQKWKFDNKGRLVASNGSCLSVSGNASKPDAKAVMQSCTGNSYQKWSLDNSGRLTGTSGLCLQGKNGNVIASACSKSNMQKWR